MSNFKKGDWCDAVDGLYWQFIETNREFFSSNPRLGLMVRSLDKINLDRKAKIYKAADTFRDMNTYV
jgi:deoxyribodipyrimidine photolyase-related protein